MPTRKQRRKTLKERRHEYETVWVDSEGNEVDDPPDEPAAATPQKRDGAKAKPKAKPAPQRGGRAARTPPPPSWRRAVKRSLIIGGVVFAAFYILGSRQASNRLASAVFITAIYVALFIPFTYYLDRFTYNRWQRRTEQQGAKAPARKR
jgi:hypothetical protein